MLVHVSFDLFAVCDVFFSSLSSFFSSPGNEQHSKGHLDNKDPASVASFLRTQAGRLDKTEVQQAVSAVYTNSSDKQCRADSITPGCLQDCKENAIWD